MDDDENEDTRDVNCKEEKENENVEGVEDQCTTTDSSFTFNIFPDPVIECIFKVIFILQRTSDKL